MPAKIPNIIEPLGFTDDGRYAYYVQQKGTIEFLTPARHRKVELVSFATSREWEDAIAVNGLNQLLTWIAKSELYEVCWDKVGEWLMSQCRACGPYDASMARGRGAWSHSSGAIVFNTGAELYIFSPDGGIEKLRLCDIQPTKSDPHRYVASRPLSDPPADREASAQECTAFRAAVELSSLKRRTDDAELILGWLACAAILNLISFRPQIAITAQKGAGKTTLLNALKRVVGSPNCHFVEGEQTSEAGIRQSLGADALPLICDEFETSHSYAQAVLDLLRIASNPGAGSILKGTPDGKPIRYVIHTMGLLAGINMGLDGSPATRSRFAVIELETRSHTEEEVYAFEIAFDQFTRDFGARLCRRLFNRLPQFKETLIRFRRALKSGGFDDRGADLYGHLLAGAWVACNDDVVLPEEAAKKVTFLKDELISSDSEGRECLDHLLCQRAQSGSNLTVSEMIELVADGMDTSNDEASRELATLGVRVEGDLILIANKVPGLERLYRGTPWRSGAHQRALVRLGALPWPKTVNFRGARSRAVAIPLRLVVRDD